MTGRPRRGPIARAYRVLYWIFAVGFLLSVSLSVTWHVMGPSARPDGGVTLDRAACTRGARSLNAALHAKATELLAEPVPSPALAGEWNGWSAGWHTQARQLRSRCPVKEDAQLRRLIDDVERMHLAWTTGLNSFVEVGRRPLERLNTDFAAGTTRAPSAAP